MTSFMHKLVEELRTREQYLEEHSANPIFDNDESGEFRREYDKLMAELKDFNARVRAAKERGEDFDKHFEKEIQDEHHEFKVKVESWSRKLKS